MQEIRTLTMQKAKRHRRCVRMQRRNVFILFCPEDQKEKLVAIFDEFEANETAEAKFAHAMDNLQPLLLNNSNDGNDWKEHGVSAAQVYGRPVPNKGGL